MVAARRAALALAVSAVLGGCDAALEGPPYRAQIVDLVGIDPSTSEPTFSLVTREFSLLDDLDGLSAPQLRLYRGGTLFLREIAGSVVIDGRIEGAESPRLRYLVDDGVAIARDYPTLAMLSAYYQYERVIVDLQRVTGLTGEDLFDAMGQLEVFFEPAIRAEDELGDAELIMKFNAFYMPGLQQFGLAQRSRLEEVPLSVNLQVIAHEFGHGLFELTFFENDHQDCEERSGNAGDPFFPGRFSIEYAISGFNEGFADFISFAYTGGTNPVISIPFDSVVERDMARTSFRFAELGGVEPPCGGEFYCIGTLFARSLYDALVELGYDPLDPEARGVFSRQVVAAMGTTQQAMRELPAAVMPEPSLSIAECRIHHRISPFDDGALSGAFLAAFTSQMPAEARAPLCAAFIEHFGDLGFPEAARAEVCDEA
jgi:hypothetical protein